MKRCWFCRHDPDQIHDPALARKLGQIFDALNIINLKLEKIMPVLDDILTGVKEESDLDDSIITLLNNIEQQLKDAIAANDPAKMQAVLDAIAANKAKISAAITANTTT